MTSVLFIFSFIAYLSPLYEPHLHRNSNKKNELVFFSFTGSGTVLPQEKICAAIALRSG